MMDKRQPDGRKGVEKGRERRETARAAVSARLPGGERVEMIHQREEGRTAFLVFSDGVWHEESEVELAGGRLLRPYSSGNSLLEHQVVLFPSWVESYSSDEELLADVRAFIHRYVDLSAGFEEIAAHYVLLSWIFDDFDALPYLRVRGDYGSGKSRFLQAVGSVAYRPIFASGASSVSSLFRMIDAFRGTLVLDESDFRASDEKAEVTKILNNGNSRGFPVLRVEQTASKEFNPRAFEVYGPKILATRRYFEDKALESRCITEELVQGRIRKDVPLSLPDAFHAEAETLRNKLLLWRFVNAGRKRREVSIQPGLEPRVAQVFGPLLSTAHSDEARERIRSRAREVGRELLAEREGTMEAELLAVVRDLEKEGQALSVSAIAERFRDRHGFDYDQRITPRWTGYILRRRLLLKTRKSHGVFVVPPSELPKLHLLYARYAVGDSGDFGDFATEPGKSS